MSVLNAVCVASLIAGVLVGPPGARAEGGRAVLGLTDGEVRKIVAHGPWPPAVKRDPSNRGSGVDAAIELGRALFFDVRLSSSSAVSCASCHKPDQGWTDGVARSRVTGHKLDRNTQTVLDVRFNRWFGWDGQADSLWAQSIRPIVAPREMNASAGHVADLMRADEGYRAAYATVFGSEPSRDGPEATLVNVGKALAAFQETLISPRTPFDAFRDALARQDWAAAARYPQAALRGAKKFVGRGKCNVCHFGARFTSGEFHDAGVPYFIAPGVVDPGRYKGIAAVKRSPWNLAGKYNDDPHKAGAWATRQVRQLHRNFGEFKIPSLRGLVATAPYMHDGSLPTLERVVRHYSEINLERLHADGERILVPLKLSAREIADMVAFLASLSVAPSPSEVQAVPAKQ